MSSRCPEILAVLVLAAALPASAARELRVCADPDNLPYSHANGTGFENRIAELVAQDLGAELRYEWFPLRRGFVRKTLGEGLCDVLMGVPVAFDRVRATRAYYRSSYVFVSRERSPLDSFDDARITRALIGVQLVGNDMAATPAGHALALRGAVDNVRGYTVYGDGPAGERLVKAVAAGELEAAVAWGPAVGYFAAHAPQPMHVARAVAPAELASMPFDFGIGIGVARGNDALRNELDGVIERRRADIEAILREYAVPLVEKAR